MKVKKLIKELKKLDPDSPVIVYVVTQTGFYDSRSTGVEAKCVEVEEVFDGVLLSGYQS